MPTWMMATTGVLCILAVTECHRQYRTITHQRFLTATGIRHMRRVLTCRAIAYVALLPLVFLANVHWLPAVVAWFLALHFGCDAIVYLLHKGRAGGSPTAHPVEVGQ